MDFKNVNSINDIPQITLDKIKHFFTHYKDNDKNKWVKVDKFGDKEEAQIVLEKSESDFYK